MSASFSPAAERICGLHQIDAGDLLGHAVLDLQPRVHLEKIERAVRPDAAFRPCRCCRSPCRARCRRSSPLRRTSTRARGHWRRRRFLDHLLVAPLRGAVALAEMRAPLPCAVTEDLELRRGAAAPPTARDRPRALPKPRAAMERGALDGFEQLRFIPRRQHPDTASAAGGLHQHRKADLPRGSGGSLPGSAGSTSDPLTIGMPWRAASSRAFVLCPIAAIHRGDGPMKRDPLSFTRWANCSVLREEPVARDAARRRPTCAITVHQRVLVEIALARRRLPNGMALIRQLEVRRAPASASE